MHRMEAANTQLMCPFVHGSLMADVWPAPRTAVRKRGADDDVQNHKPTVVACISFKVGARARHTSAARLTSTCAALLAGGCLLFPRPCLSACAGSSLCSSLVQPTPSLSLGDIALVVRNRVHAAAAAAISPFVGVGASQHVAASVGTRLSAFWPTAHSSPPVSIAAVVRRSARASISAASIKAGACAKGRDRRHRGDGGRRARRSLEEGSHAPR